MLMLRFTGESLGGATYFRGQVITYVDRFAMRGDVIFGQGKEFGLDGEGFFVVQLPSDHESLQEPNVWHLQDERSWKERLAEFGIAGDVPLADPREIAAKKPYREVAPWDFELMHGFLGQTDGDLAAQIQLATMGVALLVGLIFGRRLQLGIICTVLCAAAGFYVNLFVDIMLMGGWLVGAIFGYGGYRFGALFHNRLWRRSNPQPEQVILRARK